MTAPSLVLHYGVDTNCHFTFSLSINGDIATRDHVNIDCVPYTSSINFDDVLGGLGGFCHAPILTQVSPGQGDVLYTALLTLSAQPGLDTSCEVCAYSQTVPFVL